MANSEARPRLSLVIPAYNEEQRLGESLRQVAAFVAAQDYATEVIVVNNNSTDATPQIAAQFAAEHSYARVIDEPERGKGAAVRTGIMAAAGEFLFACDADFSMPVTEISKFLPPACRNYDVAIASREAPGAQRIDEPHYRHLMGRVFNLIVQLIAVPGIHDTQCGFKCFHYEAARAIFPLQTITGWGFDVEILFIARRLGYRLVEVPIIWYYRPQSRISPLRDSFRMLLEVLRVRLNGWRGLYGRGRS